MQKKQTILVVTSLLVVVLSVTLAYFTAQIIGKGKSVTINSADLKIIFTDSDGSISGTNIEPGWSTSKTFTITNKSNETYKYNIVIQDLINTFVTEGYLQYKITSDNGGYSTNDYVDVPKIETATDTILAYSASIDVGVTQNYTIKFIYKNDEEVDQSDDMGKTLSGKLFITEGTIDPAMYAGYEKGTLGYQVLGNNTTREVRTDFNSKFTKTNTETLFTSTESIAGSTPVDVYYFAGNATDNWVKFGKYKTDYIKYRGYYSATESSFVDYDTMNECTSATRWNYNCTEYKLANAGDDMYWRIIRTNHDKSIRLLYFGTSPSSVDGHIGTSAFNSTYTDPMYLGYKFGTSGSLENNRTNENDSTIKIYIDTWYKNNFGDYTKYLSEDAVYCNDRELASGETYSMKNNFYYASYERLYKNNQPTYNCTNISDAFSVNNVNAKLDYPIALMTADEMIYSGDSYEGYFDSASYSWYKANSSGESVTGSNHWHSISPEFSSNSYGIYNNVILAIGAPFESGTIRITKRVSTLHVVRPVISLKSCVKYSSGDGSPSNPYEIDYDNSNC